MKKLSSLGELIRYHRNNKRITLEKLDQLTNVDKSNISRIESGQIKRPTLEAILKIGSTLEIPKEELMEPYIEVEERSEVLFTILNDFNHSENIQLLKKIAKKILQSPTEDSVHLVEKLYSRIASIEEPSTKLALYQLIVNYSRAYGIMPYFAKSLLQTYLIKRDDFTKLRSTYESGKGILEFEEFLTSEEKGIMYYKLATHAYNLCLFKDSVELGEKALDAKIYDTKMKADSIYTVCNGYYYLGYYEQTKDYLAQYKEFSLPEVKDNAKITETMLLSANGNHQLAISELRESLPYCLDDALLHVVNHLITLNLQTKKLSELQELFQLEEKLLSIPSLTPFKHSQLALYFKLKGDYYILLKKIEEGIGCYLEAAKRYAKVDLVVKESECLRQTMHNLNKEEIDSSLIEQIEVYFDEKVRKGD
ncbi:helix-turn-helix domain-containing protein [Chengkuizengella marina]|uniref:XRE family transcriptional regulator n=1 Tax=Chengkuizengella marina TaxID=2507566 RepID=A0A6N9Q2U5_9BACL|nr:helix-turn-helix transcriptional regulator [Chengkuizengella marina]NBI29118.1 XRE family transcriptional regulator [Chengkuizengella marina]